MRTGVIRQIGLLVGIGLAVLPASDVHKREARQRPPLQDVRELIDSGRYDAAERAAREQLSHAARGGFDSLPDATVADLLVLAAIRNGKGSAPGTRALAERTLALKQDRLGTEHPAVAVSLLNLAEVLVDVPDYRRAISLAETAVALRERSPPTAGSELADALDTLGFVLAESGAHADAVAALTRSLRIRERALEGEGMSVVRTLELLATTLQLQGDYASARPLVERALAAQQGREPHPALVMTLNVYALQLWFEDRASEARIWSDRAVAAAEQLLRPNHPALARSLINLAAALISLGDIQLARSLQERAVAVTEVSFGPDHHETAACLNDLAHSNLLLGEYSAARRQFERALRIAEARFGRVHEWVATYVHNLALVDARLGDVAAAQRQLDRAVDIWEQVNGPDHPFVAVALTELAAVVREQGDAAGALPLLERALAIRERRLGTDHRDVALTLGDLAATVSQIGESERAQALATRAVRIWETADAPDSPDFAQTLALQAELHAARGDTAAAREYFERALAIRAKVFGPSHPAVADTQVGLAGVLAMLGHRASAVQTAVAAESTGREHLRLMVRTLPERQSLNYAARRPRGLDLVLSLAPDIPGSTIAAFDALVRSRALVLDEMAVRARASSAAGGELAPLREQLESSRQRLANLVVRGPDGQSPDGYVALVAEARAGKEAAERMLGEQSSAFSAVLSYERAGLDEVRRALPAGSALLSFARYGRTVFGAPAPGGARAPRSSTTAVTPSYLAFVLPPDGDPVVIGLGAAAVVDTLVARWRKDVADEAARRETSGASAISPRVSGERLRSAIWDPMAAYLRDATAVFVVPDDVLSLVPLAALPGVRAEFLLEEAPVIHYLSAERDILQPHENRAESARGLLAVGGPAFDDASIFSGEVDRPASELHAAASSPLRAGASTCGTFQSMTFPLLAGTAQEVRDLAEMWQEPGAGAAGDVRLLLASEATERTFKEQAPRHEVIHLATHGFFLGASCPSATDGLRAVGGLASARGERTDRRAIAQAESPLLLSGVALAGANRRALAGVNDDDGILTAEEVSALDLTAVRWAVLSACDTGVGEIRAGEGVFGLRRAFQLAGARTVIMSLWSVDDDATRRWMRALYEGRLRNLSTADAIREASLHVLRTRRAAGQSTHPFYWAAFVAAGDWR